MAAPWLRWQATLAQDPRMRRAGHWGGIVYRALLEMTKAQGWEGVIAREDVDGEILADHLAVRGPGRRAWVRELAKGIEACERENLLRDDGDAWVITDWKLYQGDPTAADRMRRMRQRRAGVLPPEQPSPPGASNVTGVTVTPVSHGDVTGRDVTGRRDGRQPVVDSDVDVIPPAPGPTNGHGGPEGGAPGAATAACRRCKDGLTGNGSKSRCCRCARGRQRALNMKRASEADRAQAARVEANRGPHRGKTEPMADILARIASKAVAETPPAPRLLPPMASGG